MVSDEPQDRVLEDSFGEGGFPEEPFIHSTPAPASASTPAPAFASTPAPASLSEEQRQRIELNKKLALERRLARMQQQGDAHAQSSHSMFSSDPSPSKTCQK